MFQETDCRTIIITFVISYLIAKKKERGLVMAESKLSVLLWDNVNLQANKTNLGGSCAFWFCKYGARIVQCTIVQEYNVLIYVFDFLDFHTYKRLRAVNSMG